MATIKYPERFLDPGIQSLQRLKEQLYAMFREGREAEEEAPQAPGPARVDLVPTKGTEGRYIGTLTTSPGGNTKGFVPAKGTEKRYIGEVTVRREPARAGVDRIVEERLRAASTPAELPTPATRRARPTAPLPAREARETPAPPDPRGRRAAPVPIPEARPERADREELPRRERTTPERVSYPRAEPDGYPPADPFADLGYPDSIYPKLGGGGGTTVFVGKVASGTGDTYQVALYPDGSHGDAGDTVEVTIPMIAEDETIDPETWLFGIFLFTDADGNEVYEAQPPVWMS